MPREKAEELADVLSIVKERLLVSEESLWCSRSPAQVVAILDQELESLSEVGQAKDGLQLRVLFAPTGDLQEISMANGWAQEYLSLSARFDSTLDG